MNIHSRTKDYSVLITENVFDHPELLDSVKSSGRRFYFVDASVYRLYREPLERLMGDSNCLVIDARETNKEYSALAPFYETLIKNGFKRNDVLVTLGGGILQDISGFIASTLYRGVPWIFIPTTLLAQADSCIGSKTSINFKDTKNLIGSFYPPDLILIDVVFCTTLSDSYFQSGLGEVIKYHLMVDETKFDLLKAYLTSGDLRNPLQLKPILLSSLEIKRTYFEEDEFDRGRRNLLNYGHCFGHALESASNFAVSHGEAVIVGMGFANLVSLNRGLLEKDRYEEIERLLRPYYPRDAFSKVSDDVIIEYLRRDKKRVGKDLTMILCGGIGAQKKYDDITEAELRSAYKTFLTLYPYGV